MRGKILLLALLASIGACLTAQAGGTGGPPSLHFEKIIGDLRSKCADNLSLAVSDNGTLFLLMGSSPSRIAAFDSQGAYMKSFQTELPWPAEFPYLAVKGKLILQGACTVDYPWVYSATRRGSQPGAFDHPGWVAEDEAGTIYVADRGNKRIQIYSAGNIVTPSLVLPLSAPPSAIAIKGNRLAIALDDGTLVLDESEANGFKQVASLPTGTRIRSLAFGPEGSLYAAQSDKVKRYSISSGGGVTLTESATIADSSMSIWPQFFPASVPLTSAPNGEIFFATDSYGKLLSLDPATDVIRERGTTPWGARAVGFGTDGALFMATDKGGGIRIEQFTLGGDQLVDGGTFPTDPLYTDLSVPVWGLLPDTDGGVYIRSLDVGYQKGWPALSIKKVFRDGPIKPFLDFGPLYGVRTRFAPSAAYYSMKFDLNRNIIFTATPLRAVYKVAPNGKILWEAGVESQGGADKIDFGAPRDVAIDLAGDIWVVDSEKNSVFCLSPEGKLLMSYGVSANMDDVDGKGFNEPSGIAVAEVNGGEFLYVGDGGNYRLVKFKIVWP